MKISLAVAFWMLGSASACWAQSAAKQACDVQVDVTDTDPKGTNVRATPGGAIIATLKDSGDDDWILVHVTAQFGDWFEIDRASLIGADQPTDGKLLFKGMGYLHKSVVGVSGMQNGGVIYLEHNLKSGLLDGHAAGDQQVDLLGCWGDFLKVHVKKGVGWTQQACTNMNTTCA
jgi:hypothetical protein